MTTLWGLLMLLTNWLLNPLLWLLLLAFAVYTLRRTRDGRQPLRPADRRWRPLAVGVLGLMVGGFGLCGGGGTLIGLWTVLGASAEGRGYALLILASGVLGLVIAGLGLWLLRRYRRQEAP